MENHYHLIIETLDTNLSLRIRRLSLVYTQAFNHVHQRVGHVFQDRYKALRVEKGSHLLELCRYVVLNPVRAGMVVKPDEWKWSSHRNTAYTGNVPEYLSVDWVLGQFADQKTTARQRYREFVTEGLKEQTGPCQKLTGQVFLGSEEFVSRMRGLLGERHDIKEILRAQRYPGRPSLERCFANVDGSDREQRQQQVMEAHITNGYTLKEIMDCLGIHYTTVSKIVSKTTAVS